MHVSHRRFGIGTALVREAEKRLEALGYVKINLQVLCGKATAVAFYRALGYDADARISMAKRRGRFAN